MTTKPRWFTTFGFATHASLFAAYGCREYTCVDTASCPVIDAGAQTDAASALGTSGLVSPAPETPGLGSATFGLNTAVATPGDPSSTTPISSEPAAPDGTISSGIGGSEAQSTPADEDTAEPVSSEAPAETTPMCPNAPGGVCQCSSGDTQRCALSGAKGACAEGTQTCSEDGVFSPCDVTPATSDDCSLPGNDADCDGTPNTGCPCVDGDTQACGPDTDVGACKFGVSTCSSSTYGQCIGAVERAPRQCDSTQDNDCDGAADNTLDDNCKCVPGDVQQCNMHPGFDGVGPCRPGNQTCELGADGTRSYWGECSGDVKPAASDSCVEGDNSDCAGAPNTSCACLVGRTETCGSRYGSKGICSSVMLTCQSNGTWPGDASCVAAAKQEICDNALDENCDGTPDDGSSCPCNRQPSPCAHGSCNAGAGSAYTCDCTGTGYEGTLCDKPIASTVAGPAGATSCSVVGVSDDGATVAANCEIGESWLRGYFWTANAWVKAAIPAGYPYASISALSSDGTKAAGGIRISQGTPYGVRWSGVTTTAQLLNTPDWKDVFSMSANGSTFSSTDPGGNLFIWTGGGSNAPITYAANAGVTGIMSGDGTKVFSAEPGDGEGFRIWSSSSSYTTRTLAEDLNPVAASNNGSVMVGHFWSAALNTIYKYNSSGSSDLTATENCRPTSLSSDGRYILGKCADGLYRWADANRTSVQSLIASTGSTVTIRTDVDGRMSYNAKYVALPSTSTGFVLVHLPSP